MFEDTDFLASQTLRFQRRGHRLITISLAAEIEDLLHRNLLRDPLQRIDEQRIRRLHSGFSPSGISLGIRGKFPEEVCDDVLEIISLEGTEEPAGGREGEVDLLFMRHGMPAFPQESYPDPFEMSLAPQGRSEALAARAAVQRFAPDVVLSSDFARATETAQLACDGLEVTVEPALRERSFFQLAGRSFDEIQREFGQQVAGIRSGNSDWVELPPDESYEDARARALSFFDRLPAIYGGRRVLVVGHRGPHSWLLERAVGAELRGQRRVRWDTGCFSRFTLSAHQTRLEALNLAPGSVVRGLVLGSV